MAYGAGSFPPHNRLHPQREEIARLKPKELLRSRYLQQHYDPLRQGFADIPSQPEDSVVIDFNYYRFDNASTPRLNEDIWEEIEQMAFFKYGVRPHWAKNRNLGFLGVQSNYPNFNKFIAEKKQLDPQGIFSSKWSDQILLGSKAIDKGNWKPKSVDIRHPPLCNDSMTPPNSISPPRTASKQNGSRLAKPKNKKEEVVHNFEGIQLQWKYVCIEPLKILQGERQAVGRRSSKDWVGCYWVEKKILHGERQIENSRDLTPKS
ncbi:hypothetical protein SLEP1_g7419 [Rubroshorea leprosula]|uniref:D-arabinono-1,4-lactone oxidase C-terminal domain-containing protein n=1 Tax=Rubroshorea leprosula TaxID=152421 RepID=A0AAV5I6C8_9ROSI|nr:hypothetical protein SLEP1_g7419 [Rubroshorea leprosula]